MAENRTKTPEALRAFPDKMIVIISVVLLITIASWLFIFLVCGAANTDASMLTHALRRAQCEDAGEAWRENRTGMLLAIGMFPVILALRALRKRLDADASASR